LKNLVKVKKKDLPIAAKTLALAFMKDPLSKAVFVEESTRFDYLLDYFRFRIHYGIKYGYVYASSDKFEGIAVWIPSDKAHVSTWRGMLTGGLRLYAKVGFSMVSKFDEVNHYTTSLRDSVIEPPYIQLSPIGVTPDEQGKGLGTKLILPMMKKLDDDNLKCFLETQEERNVAYYQRFGFEIAKETIIPGLNLQNWVMIREPKNKD